MVFFQKMRMLMLKIMEGPFCHRFLGPRFCCSTYFEKNTSSQARRRLEGAAGVAPGVWFPNMLKTDPFCQNMLKKAHPYFLKIHIIICFQDASYCQKVPQELHGTLKELKGELYEQKLLVDRTSRRYVTVPALPKDDTQLDSWGGIRPPNPP